MTGIKILSPSVADAGKLSVAGVPRAIQSVRVSRSIRGSGPGRLEPA
jgi:hypothetical protein